MTSETLVIRTNDSNTEKKSPMEPYMLYRIISTK